MLLILLLSFCFLPVQSCKNNCSNHGECRWVHNPSRHGRPVNSTNLICECYSGFYGKYCQNNNITDSDIKKVEEEVIEEEENIIIYILSGVGGLIFLLGGIYFYYKRKMKKKSPKRKKSLEIFLDDTLDTPFQEL